MCSIGSESHLKLKSREISFAHNILSVVQSFWNFAQSTATSMPCSVPNYKTIGQLRNKLCANETLRDFRLRYVSDEYPLLDKAPGRGWPPKIAGERFLMIRSEQFKLFISCPDRSYIQVLSLTKFLDTVIEIEESREVAIHWGLN